MTTFTVELEERPSLVDLLRAQLEHVQERMDQLELSASQPLEHAATTSQSITTSTVELEECPSLVDMLRAQSARAAQLRAQLEHVQDAMDQLKLPASQHLLEHAATTSHEDLPHDHECGYGCMHDSRGTITPASSIHSVTQPTGALISIDNFGIVLPGIVYRSSYPKQKNYGFIKDLKIKSILTLVQEPISPEYQAFMDEAGIQHFQVHIKANKGKVSTESCEMSRALRLVMDRTNHPILIHCNKGKHRTGCTVACFRRILDRPMDEIVDEYHLYAGAKARLMDEVFFEGFDLNLVMWMARQEGWVAPQLEIAPPSRLSFMPAPRVTMPQA